MLEAFDIADIKSLCFFYPFILLGEEKREDTFSRHDISSGEILEGGFERALILCVKMRIRWHGIK